MKPARFLSGMVHVEEPTPAELNGTIEEARRASESAISQ